MQSRLPEPRYAETIVLAIADHECVTLQRYQKQPVDGRCCSSTQASTAPRRGVTYKYQIAAEGLAGSLVIRLGGVWHSFGPNNTRDKERVGFMGGYFARWMGP